LAAETMKAAPAAFEAIAARLRFGWLLDASRS
jgi:hypothetical protein